MNQLINEYIELKETIAKAEERLNEIKEEVAEKIKSEEIIRVGNCKLTNRINNVYTFAHDGIKLKYETQLEKLTEELKSIKSAIKARETLLIKENKAIITETKYIPVLQYEKN